MRENSRNKFEINKKAAIFLFVSLLVMSVANTFFLPYIITSLLNGTNMEGYNYLIGIVLAALSLVGIIWSLFSLADIRKSPSKTARSIFFLFLFGVIAIVASVLFSFISGLLATMWYYILKNNIITAKFAIDITSRVLSIPLIAFFLCIFGNIFVRKEKAFAIKSGTYFKIMLVVALCTALQYLMILPGIGDVWFLVLSCIVDAVLYTVMFASAVSLCGKELEQDEE